MTDTALIALIGIVPTTIAAITAAVVSIRNGRKADKLATKTEEIHVLTNSNLAAVKAELKSANDRIVGLEKLITGMGKPTT